MSIRKFNLLFCLFGCISVSGLWAQNKETAKGIINELSAPEMHGRGYVAGGDSLAANYIAGKMFEMGLQNFGNSYFQSFNFNVNTFPGEMDITIDGKSITQGYDYHIDPASKGIKGEFDMAWLDSGILFNKPAYKSAVKKLRKKVLVVDLASFKGAQSKKLQSILENKLNAKGIIILTDGKLTWSVSQKQIKFCRIIMKKDKMPANPKHISMNVEAVFKKSHQANNVIGFVKGKDYPDSFIVFSAHYDHLGRMGRYIFFPGANDNAAGIAMLLDLAKYYTIKQPRYSIVFMAFAGEEAGLIGSKYFVDHPMFPLKNIRFLINMDLVATGEKGATVVNGDVFKNYYGLLYEINTDYKLLPSLNSRGKSANSDHYWFTEAGVPSFFIYLMGNYNYYHDIYDSRTAIKLEGYSNLWLLLYRFADSLMVEK